MSNMSNVTVLPVSRPPAGKNHPSRWAWSLAIMKILAIGQLVYLSNAGFSQRVSVLFERGQYETLLPFLLVWAVAILALVVAAFHHSRSVRLLWGLFLGFGTAVGLGYFMSSQSQLTAQDLVSFWNAGHEAGHAASQYMLPALYGIAALFLYVFANLLPGPTMPVRLQRPMRALALLPLAPAAMIAGVVWLKGHTGSQALPNQFVPASLAAVVVAKLYSNPLPEREGVQWQAGQSLSRNIVMLVDESIRADYLDFTIGNPFTPHLSAVKDRFVNFGPAASGGNCSNYSNVLLRFLASRKDLRTSINRNASVFAYAKNAGFRTVYIDAQAGNITDGNMLQNFMTMREREDIDVFHGVRNVAGKDADMELLRVMAEELKSPQPTFIYANKYGAHFPYDEAYPSEARIFQPTQSEEGDTPRARQASYRNAVQWSVDRVLPKLFETLDLRGATLFYTSDHGQLLEPGRLTHCQVEGSDERMALVPLLVHTDNDLLRRKLEQGALMRQGNASHFHIAGTLLEIMGYAPKDVAGTYDETLTDGITRAPFYSTGDIFGLFQDDVIWNAIDLRKDHLEPNRLNQPASTAGSSNTNAIQG